MKMTSRAVCYGIKCSKGKLDNGQAFDSTTFFLSVDIGESTTGESMGIETRPFKFGTSDEFKKWAHLKNSFPVGGIPVECDFDVVAGADNKVKLTLLGIKPVSAGAAKAA